MKRSILSLALLWLPLGAGAEVFMDKGGRTAPPLAEGSPWPFTAPKLAPSASVSADWAKPIGRFTRFHLGGNTSWWSRTDWNLHEDRIAKMRQAGFGLLRFPGGSSSDFYFWDKQYGKYAKSYNGEDSGRMAEPQYMDFDAFMQLCSRTGAEPILTLNYGLARYGSLPEATDLAVRWLRYAKKQGYKIRYVEVGNENYGPWEAGSDKVPGKERLTGEQYGKDVRAFVKALKAVDPQLQVGAVICPDDGGEDWVGFRWWNRGVMTQVKGAADFLVVHEYFLWPFDQKQVFIRPSKEKLLGNLGRIAKLRAQLDDMMDRYMGRRIPVSFNEFNIINASSSETIEAVNLVFTAAALGEMARLGFATANLWDWQNGLDGKLKGDHGMLALGDPDVPDHTPRPSYYAYALWKLGAGDQLLETQVVGQGLRAYASRFAGGQAGFILVNEREQAQTVSLELQGRALTGALRAWCAYARSLDSKTVALNGVNGPLGGGGPFPIEGVKPYALQAKNGRVEFTLPPASVSALIAY